MSLLGKAGIVGCLQVAALLLFATACSTPHYEPPRDWQVGLGTALPAATPLEEDLDQLELEAAPASAPLSFPPAPLASEWLDGPWTTLKRWCAANGFPPAQRATAHAFSPQIVQVGNNSMVFVPGNRAARWRGMEIHLGYAPRLANGDLLVHTLDLRKTVDPLLLGAQPPVLDQSLPIVIDPGHGGEDSGASSTYIGIPEKHLTLDWARRTADLLTARGYAVVLTRTNDIDIALSNRVSVADTVRASAFVSLHFNSGRTEAGRGGVETYCTSYVWSNNWHDNQNLLLACRVHQEILAVPGVRDRGVRRARFMSVLRTQQRPAVLIEGGYLSDPVEARLIATAAHRQKLAQAVVQALVGQEVLVGSK
jgi:N-acetylmuramoyl-L-alanine amidase